MKNILSFILRILLIVLLAAVLELNHNTLIGWFLFAALSAGYLYLRIGHHGNGFLLFLGYVLCFALIMFISWPPVRNVPAVSNRNPKHTDIISIPQGQLRGVLNKDETVEVYAGIPYAKAPVGDLRWKEPQDPDAWEGLLEADRFAPMNMQEVSVPIYDSLVRIIGYHDYRISLFDNYRPPVSEDSLYLNIWKPAGEQHSLPVLVYIHGGSLQTGQAWYQDYSGEALAREGVIVVNMAYRLGIFGFYANEELANESADHTTGNYGLLDMIKALEWVRDNIAYFGGDPNNVTLAGESAGSAAVSALCTSPLTEGLFRRAVMESSTVASIDPPHSYRSYEEALASGKELMERYGVSSIFQLREMKAEDLVKEASSQHHITVDGHVLTEDPYLSYKKGIHNEEAILHGYNLKESGPFVLFSQASLKDYEERIRHYFGEHTQEVLDLYPASTDKEAREYWAHIYGAVFFNYPHYCLNRLAAENGIPVYEYLFSKNNGRLGSWHSGEEVYLYGNIPDDSSLYDESDRRLSETMMNCLLNFIRYGSPNGTDHTGTWPENTDSITLLEFGDEVGVIDERFVKLYDILDKVYGWK